MATDKNVNEYSAKNINVLKGLEAVRSVRQCTSAI